MTVRKEKTARKPKIEEPALPPKEEQPESVEKEYGAAIVARLGIAERPKGGTDADWVLPESRDIKIGPFVSGEAFGIVIGAIAQRMLCVFASPTDAEHNRQMLEDFKTVVAALTTREAQPDDVDVAQEIDSSGLIREVTADIAVDFGLD
jgi:hypothetical protein